MVEKVAYIKGLADGLGVDDSTKEGKLIRLMLDLMNDMAETIEALEDENAEILDGFDALDEDLAALAEDFYDDECGCDCDECADGEFYEITCPKCGEHIYLDEDMVEEGSMECPACGENLEFDLSDEEMDD